MSQKANYNTIKRKFITIYDSLMLIDTWQISFDMCQFENRRFMFSPQSGELILGKQYKGNQIRASHAEEHGKSGTKTAYDSFIRGWIGTSRQYSHGIIHFAPHVESVNSELFEKAFLTLEMFGENGAGEQTVIRGFGSTWEQPLSDIVSNQKCSVADYIQHKTEALEEMRSKAFSKWDELERRINDHEQG